MYARASMVLGLGALLGVLFATWLQLPVAQSEEAPTELAQPPAAPSARAREFNRPFVAATRKARLAVVRITNVQVSRGRVVGAGGGSGFIISKQGHILTNRHVILDATRLIVDLGDGRRFEKVKVLGADPRSDVAILKIPVTDGGDALPVAQLGDSDRLEVGEWVIAIGSPFKLASSVSVGVVSATGRTGVVRGQGTSEEFIQTDASLNPGNSGGPLINLDGHVVGLNTAIQTGGRSRSSAGIGFAIPINLARTIAVALIEKGVAKRGWLGLGLKMARYGPRVFSRAELKTAGIKAQGALLVSMVEKGSPASHAAIRVGHYLTAVDGRPMLSGAILYARLAQAGPAGKVTLTIDGDRDVVVVLGEERLKTYGIEVEDLDDAKAGELGLPRGTRGVVVSRILSGSVAGRAPARNKLMPGDVITRILWSGGHEAAIKTKRDFEQTMARLTTRPPGIIRIIFRTGEGRYRVDLYPRGS